MTAENPLIMQGVPLENLSRGLMGVEIPELGQPIRGKVRDNWVVEYLGMPVRVMVTTDRLSAYDRGICLLPYKGEVLNGLAAWWFDQTGDIIPHHAIAVPHHNVMVARQARATLPVEVVMRGYLAESSSSTSVFYNYEKKGRREIYGLEFPDGLQPNQELPMGPILTPTTKAEHGHDEELTDDQAAEIVDGQLGSGTWQQAKAAAQALFERGQKVCRDHGLILADTKYEFGIREDGQLMLIDEIHTPDSSRFWLLDTYESQLAAGLPPESFDKELIRKWLASKGFRGEGPVPIVDQEIISQTAAAYQIPFRMLTGLELDEYTDQGRLQDSIREAVVHYLHL